MRETSLSLALSFLAFIMTVIWGSPLIKLLRFFKVGKIIREEGPGSHIDKLGNPHNGRFHDHRTCTAADSPAERSYAFGF